MIAQKDLLQEIIDLNEFLLQKIYQIQESIFVFEIFHKNHKKLYLVFDGSAQFIHLHVQKEKLKEKKCSSNLLQGLKKYLIGKITIYQSASNNADVVLYAQASKFNLLLSLSTTNALLFKENKFFLAYKKDYEATLPPFIPLVSAQTDLEKNFSYAKIYNEKFTERKIENLKTTLSKELRAKFKKQKKLVENLQNDVKKWVFYLGKEHEANLLKTNMHKVKKGDTSVVCIDYELDPPKEKVILVEANISISSYVENLFKKIKKAKKSIGMIEQKLDKAQAQLNQIELDLENVKNTQEEHKLLDETKVLKEHRKIIPAQRMPYKEFLSADKIRILVGKSAKDSDEMLKKYGQGNDWWFHSRDIKGAHVIVKFSGENIPPDTFLQACMLAAYFSKDKSLKVDVQYTRLKQVKKPKNAKPGQVIVSKEKTMLVNIDEDKIKAWTNSL